MLHDARKVVAPLRAGHSERLEQALDAELSEGCATDALHDHGGERVPRVAVEVLGARLEVERLLMLNEIEDGVQCVDLRSWPHPLEAEQPPLVTEAAGVSEQVPNGDRLPEPGHFRQVLPDIVVEGELAVLRQQHDCRGRELLGHGPAFEYRLRRIGHVVLEIREPIRARKDGLAVLAQTHRAPGRPSAAEAGERAVDLRDDAVWERGDAGALRTDCDSRHADSKGTEDRVPHRRAPENVSRANVSASAED